jgi:acetamidase/formamidase
LDSIGDDGAWIIEPMSHPAASLHVTREQNHLAWDPAIPPVASIGSGDVVEFDCLDASNGQITAASTTESLETLIFDQVDQVTGPVEVAGAEPGDTLQIDLLEFENADWGWTASIPGFGLLADDFPDAFLKITNLPSGDDRVEFWPGVRIPLAPFCGELGVAPKSGPLSTIPPDLHGGNMDTRHLVAGSTLFLPVFHPGARFSIGDGHATQGDGEVSGTAIETPMRALVRLTVRKDLHVTGPEFVAAADPHAALRNGPRYATDGIGPDLMDASRDALRRMTEWLGREHGLEPMQAYLLASVAVDLRISEIVDVPNFVVTAHCPLGIFD